MPMIPAQFQKKLYAICVSIDTGFRNAEKNTASFVTSPVALMQLTKEGGITRMMELIYHRPLNMVKMSKLNIAFVMLLMSPDKVSKSVMHPRRDVSCSCLAIPSNTPILIVTMSSGIAKIPEMSC